jgi:TRAP-type C4-dicarboxylate transport system substrate-binding protein
VTIMSRQFLTLILSSSLLLMSCGGVSSPSPSSSVAVGTTVPATQLPKVRIQMIGQPTPTLLQYTNVEVPYATKNFADRSNGRFEVVLRTYAEANVAQADAIRLIKQGQVDVINITLTIVAGDVPLLDAADLDGLNPTIEQARKVVSALIPEANTQLEKFGTKIVATNPYPAQVFFCRQAISGLADLKGRKIRTRGPADADLVGALGAQAVSVAVAETYSALERGVVDCAITGTAGGNSLKWYEVATHLYTLPLAWAIGAYVVNLTWWNGLDQQARDLLTAIFGDMENDLYKLGADLTQDGIDCNVAASSCKLGVRATRPMVAVQATATDRTQLSKILEETIIPNWVKRCGAACGDIFNKVVSPIAGVKYVAR